MHDFNYMCNKFLNTALLIINFLLLELCFGESQSMGYFMEDQVEQHFRYVLSICACYKILQT